MSVIKVQRKSNNNYIDSSFPIVDIIPLTLRFYIEDIGFNPVEYLWDFGDGEFSNDATPIHTFTTYGYHYIIVKVRTNNTWTIIGDQSNVVILGKIDFSADVVKGDKPLEVQFENKSISPTGVSLSDFNWDFGDGFSATGMQGPIHIYQEYGNYDVKLSANIDLI